MTSVTLSVTGVGLIVVRITAGNACTLSLANKILHKTKLIKDKKYKKQRRKDQQTIKCSGDIYRASLQDNLIDEN